MLNNNFNELVKKYDKYRSKRRDRLLLFILVVIAICMAGFYLVTNSNFIMNSFKMTSTESNMTVSEAKKDDNKNQTTDIIKKDEITSKPATPKEQPIQRVKVDTPKSGDLPDQVYKRTSKEIKEENPFKLEVKERKSLYNLLTQDKEQNSYQSAIRIAQFYFEEKNYDQTVIWSVKASKKNPKQSLPWILYAKSKAALGKTKVAKKALSLYLKHSDSKEVRDLLDTLK